MEAIDRRAVLVGAVTAAVTVAVTGAVTEPSHTLTVAELPPHGHGGFLIWYDPHYAKIKRFQFPDGSIIEEKQR